MLAADFAGVSVVFDLSLLDDIAEGMKPSPVDKFLQQFPHFAKCTYNLYDFVLVAEGLEHRLPQQRDKPFGLSNLFCLTLLLSRHMQFELILDDNQSI